MKTYVVLLMFFVSLSGCSDWIDVEPESAVTFANFFETEKDAQSLLYTLEIGLKALPVGFDEMGELVKNQSGYTGEYLRDMFWPFDYHYKIIEYANVILDNLHRFPLSEEVLKPYELQACFAKAMAYFSLAQMFGEAPIIKDGTAYAKYPKSSEDEVLDEAEKWALRAMELPVYEELVIGGGSEGASSVELSKQYGSKGAAAALLAKIYSWRAGVLNEDEYWAKAEAYCDSIINGHMGYYALADSPETLCSVDLIGDGDEVIWEIYGDASEIIQYFYGTAMMPYNGVIGFPVVSTMGPMDYASYIVTKETVRRLYDDADRRKEAYFWGTDADSVYIKYVDGSVVPDVERGNDSVIVAYDNRQIERAFIYKYRYPCYITYDNASAPQFLGMAQGVARIRLGDIILLRAECRARQGKANAVDDLNTIRRRAYGDDSHAFPNADDVASGLANDIQLAIFREREKELILEGHRYYDVRRNGIEYVRRELLPCYAALSDQDIEDGALYYGISSTAFENNDLLRQNVYWNRRQQ